MTVRLHQADLPADWTYGEAVAIDTETLGLSVGRDRLCVVQLSRGDGDAEVVQIAPGQKSAPNLERLLADPNVVKLFHFGRFDIAVLAHAFGVTAAPVYCTKIASKLARTYTDRHGLKDLTRELIGVEISKQQQTSDWGAGRLPTLSSPTPPRTCSTCTPCARSSTLCSSARAGTGSPAPPLPICPSAPVSTSPALRRWTCFRMGIRERIGRRS